MNKTVVIGGIVAATLLAGGWALAQAGGHGPGSFGPGAMHGMHGQMGAGTHGPGMHRGAGRGMHGAMETGRHGGPGAMQLDASQLNVLKSELGITPAQESAWSAYTTAVQDAAAALQSVREGVDPEAMHKLSRDERHAFMTAMHEQARAQFEAVRTAANDLLAALDEEQKAKARERLPGLAFGPGRMHGPRIAGPHLRH